MANNKIDVADWLPIYETIDVNKELDTKAYQTTSESQKQNYFTRASYNLTIEYLYNLKKNTWYLSATRTLNHIEGLNIVRPKMGNTDSPLFNQTVFEAQNNYYDFLMQFKRHLKEKQAEEDQRYLLVEDFDVECIGKHWKYKSFAREVNNHGFMAFNTPEGLVKVYTAELALLLATRDITAQNLETKQTVALNGQLYFNSYAEGYSRGMEYFETNYRLEPSAVYGANAELYVQDLHDNYFHVFHQGQHKGWVWVKNLFPNIITHECITRYGYYAGIVTKVQDTVQKYPRLFERFDKCSHAAGDDKAKTEEADQTNNNNITPGSKVENTPKNRYPKIFVNGYAYQFFETLREQFVIEGSVYAAYSFIFIRMVSDGYLLQTNHRKLIDFLDENYETKLALKYNQFKKRESYAKQHLYSTLNKEYKSKIRSAL